MIINKEIVLPEAADQLRDQGLRPTCLAFVISDLNRSSAPTILSPEYIYQAAAHQSPGWMPGNGLILSIALAASELGQPEESQFPYQFFEPSLPLAPLPVGLTLYGRPLQVYSNAVNDVIDTIRMGTPLGLVLRLTQEFFTPKNGIVEFSTGVLPGMQHAVLAVGFGVEQSTSTLYVLIRNSWGASWGANGCAWLPYEYLKQHTSCSFGI